MSREQLLWELKRAREERDIAEMDRDAINDNVRRLELLGLDEENEEYCRDIDEMHNLDNEIMYLDSVIADYEYQLEDENA